MRETIAAALKTATKAQDKLRISTLRLVSAAIKDRDIAARTAGKGEATDAELLDLFAKQLSDADTQKAIADAIAEAGAASVKDMGKVMAALKARYAGQMDFAKASAAVKAKLG